MSNTKAWCNHCNKYTYQTSGGCSECGYVVYSAGTCVNNLNGIDCSAYRQVKARRTIVGKVKFIEGVKV